MNESQVGALGGQYFVVCSVSHVEWLINKNVVVLRDCESLITGGC